MPGLCHDRACMLALAVSGASLESQHYAGAYRATHGAGTVVSPCRDRRARSGPAEGNRQQATRIDTAAKFPEDKSNGQAPDTATAGARREENAVSLAKGKDQAPGIRLLSGGFSTDRQERFSAQRADRFTRRQNHSAMIRDISPGHLSHQG